MRMRLGVLAVGVNPQAGAEGLAQGAPPTASLSSGSFETKAVDRRCPLTFIIALITTANCDVLLNTHHCSCCGFFKTICSKHRITDGE